MTNSNKTVEQKIREIIKSPIYCRFSEVYEAEKAVEKAVKAIQSELELRDKQLRDKISTFNRRKHVCRFNDGKQTCACYYQAFFDILELIEKK